MTGPADSGSRDATADRGQTRSDTYLAESTQREAMQQELMDLGVWLSAHPEAAPKNLKPIRSAKRLEPGVYYNMGTGMVDRIYRPQRVALGHKMFRITSDPAAPAEEVRRRAMGSRERG
jgi:hypothetical protein